MKLDPAKFKHISHSDHAVYNPPPRLLFHPLVPSPPPPPLLSGVHHLSAISQDLSARERNLFTILSILRRARQEKVGADNPEPQIVSPTLGDGRAAGQAAGEFIVRVLMPSLCAVFIG